MLLQQHLLISWVLSNLNYDKKRDRIVATVSGVAPDIDGLGLVADIIVGNPAPYYYFSWHHQAGHNIFGLFFVGIVAYLICGRKILPATIAMSTYLTHIFFDLIGSGADDGSIWPVYFFWPLNQYAVTINWQWPLISWENALIAVVFIIIMITIAARKKRSFLEIVSSKLDRYCIEVVENIIKRQAR